MNNETCFPLDNVLEPIGLIAKGSISKVLEVDINLLYISWSMRMELPGVYESNSKFKSYAMFHIHFK